MSGSGPRWRRLFDRVERNVSPPLESGANSEEFLRALLAVGRVRRAVGSRIDRVASWGLHQVHLPSHHDIRSVQRQLGELQRQVSELERGRGHVERGGSPKGPT